MPRNDVRITRKEGVATIMLDGPPDNALDLPLRTALNTALRKASWVSLRLPKSAESFTSRRCHS